MKTLPANAAVELAKQYGNEPINLVSVDWRGSPVYYADRTIGGTPGKILSLGAIDSVLTVDGAQSQSIEVVLDDTDGTVKEIIDTTDVHKRPCVVYQAFCDPTTNGLVADSQFAVMKGVISTPFVWTEGDRTVKFTIITAIEDKEVGFSPEEAQFDFVSHDAIGRPWPLCFGNVVHVPATKVKQIVEGSLKEQLCFVDPMLDWRISALAQAHAQEAMIASFYGAVARYAESFAPPAETVLNQYITVIKQEDAAILAYEAAQKAYEERKIKRWQMTDEAKKAKIAELKANVKSALLALATIDATKDQLEQKIKLVQYEFKVKQEARKRQVEALDNAYKLLSEYIQLQNRWCEQQKCQKTQVGVFNGKEFPQNTLTDIVIEGIKYSGTFDGDVFNIVGGPKPVHTDVALAPRQVLLDDCERPDELLGLDTFWITDPGIILQNMYCLVTDTRGAKHVIRVINQEGTKCQFELRALETVENNNTFGGNIILSKYTLPFFGGKFGRVPVDQTAGLNPNEFNAPTLQLSAIVSSMLGTHFLNQDELENILSLQKIMPYDQAGGFNVPFPSPRDSLLLCGDNIASIEQVAGNVLAEWLDGSILSAEIPSATYWSANPGAKVVDASSPGEIYVANILPSTIKAVMTYRTIEGRRVLTQVPTSYYTKNEAEALPPLTVTSIKMNVPLTTIPGEDWDDTIYVTLDSSVGPNVCDILEHLITTYTECTVDPVSFAAVAAKFRDNDDNELYPANFALFDRRNILQQLQDIAWQARCTLYEVNNIFYIKYLAEEPESVATITESDIELQTLQLSYTETEQLVTKLIATWKPDYLPAEEGEEDTERIVLRHNVKKYGLHEQTFDFYIYNIYDLVLKSATFWLIRKANTWKRVSFNTFLTKLPIETTDCVSLDLATNYFSSAATKAIVETASYDSSTNTISLQLWLPIKAGELTPYTFAWPSSMPSNISFPTDDEIADGAAGSNSSRSHIVGPVVGE